ncbi:MAG: fibronectin type III domain-containing protein [Candidatus Pacearchaeota archaeon]
MEKRNLGLIRFIAFIFFLLITIQGIFAVTNKPKVAYIYRSQGYIDENVVDVFNEAGLETVFISEKKIPNDLSEYRFIFVGDEFFNGNIPVNKYQTILFNFNQVERAGLVPLGGIGKLASKEPLSVSINGTFVPVYTIAKDNNGVSISYYYLNNFNKAKSVKSVASTYTTSSGPDFGNVIAFVSKGEKLLNSKSAGGDICFFGITKSKYWTDEARNLFKSCVEFVNKPLSSEITCQKDSDCGISGFIDEPVCSGNDLVQKYVTYKCNKPGTFESSCSNKTTMKIVENCLICSNNTCQNVKCFKNKDCDDKNSSTEDICHKAGSLDAYCIHTVKKEKIVIVSFIATPSETSVKLDFSTNINNSVVKNYKLKNGGNDWINVDNNSYIFTGLNPDTEYTFYVQAIDYLNDSSDIVNITVRTLSLPEPPPQQPLPSSGGGGSSGPIQGQFSWCSNNWTCTQWSECINGFQTRSCGVPPGKCIPEREKPAEKRECVPSLNQSISTSLSETEDANSRKEFNEKIPENLPFTDTSNLVNNPITGAAIAANIGKYSWIWIPVLIAGIVLAYYFLAGGRFKKQRI